MSTQARVVMDRRLVDHLVNSSLVSRAAMQRMILRATKAKTGVVEQLLDDEKIDDAAVARELAAYFDLETVDLAGFSVSDTALKFISKSMADKHGVLPFAVSAAADQVTVAVFNPESAQSVIDSLKTATGKSPTVQVAPRSWLEKAIRHFYFGEKWAGAPAHGNATREVASVAHELGLGGDSSSEIVLDEVVVPPAPRPKQPEAPSRASAATLMPTPIPQQPDESKVPAPRRKKTADTPRPQAAPGRADSEGEVGAALDEFDAFLDSSTGWGKVGNRSGIPGWEEPSGGPDVQNPFARDDDGWNDPPSAGGFSLFDEKPETDGLGLRDLVDQHEDAIDRLRGEVQQQRDIITALVDALVEAGVVSKRDIKHRVKRK